MKYVKIILTFIFLCYGERICSQTDVFTPEWSYGVNGGITFSKVGFNSVVSVPQQLFSQYSGGITIRYISENHFGILGELNYSLRGWKERTDTVHLNRYTRSIAYLELPLMTHIYFNLGKHLRFMINLGPQIGYYIGAKEIEREVNDNGEDTSYYDIPVQHALDYGLKGTMGLEFLTKAGSFILDGRYYFGLSDIFNSTRADLFQASHNQIIGVNLTYLIRRK